MENSKRNHYYVNWVDGMKISSSNEENPTDSIQLSIDGQNKLSVQVGKCKAVTQGGYFIDISNETNALRDTKGKFTTVTTDIDTENATSESYYVILNINPYDKIPVGEANTEEEPPRHPFVISKFTLSTIAEDQIQHDASLGDSFLIIGKIVLDSNNSPELDPNYIPPCYSIQSHQDLIYIYSEIGVFYNALEKYCLQIIQKIFQKKQSNELAHMVLSLSQNVWQFTSGIIPEYRIEDRTASPVKIITKLITLSRIIKNSIDVYIGTGKEELVNYLVDWSDTSQGEFEKILDDMIAVEYKHYDVNLSLETVSKFSRVMLSLFKKLEELDYIGKKSDSNIFVKEEVVVKQDVKQRRSFLLD